MDPTEDKEQHGTLATNLPVSSDTEVDSRAARRVLYSVIKAVRSSSLTSAILSVGLVIALCEFIYLSFLMPDASNIIIPLILKPIIDILAKRYVAEKKE